MDNYKLILFLAIFLSGMNSLIGQQHLNFILFVDEEIPSFSQVGNTYMTIEKSTLKSDTLQFDYIVGELLFSDSAYFNLKSLQKNLKVQLHFDIVDHANEFSMKHYIINLNQKYLMQKYLIIRLFDFSNKKNNRNFVEREGYSFEFESSIGLGVIPRKRTKRRKCK